MSDKFLLLVNNVYFPPPKRGMKIIRSTALSSGRNTNGAVVGQIIGRQLYKIDGLEWDCLDAETWTAMVNALKPFFVKVSFYDDTNQLVTHTFYPGDITAEPYWLDDNGKGYKMFKSCKVNLIDCGKED